MLLTNDITHVDFFSLDVEGYELEVLEGTDTSIIDVILVETDYPSKVAELLPYHRMEKKLTHHDYLFVRK